MARDSRIVRWGVGSGITNNPLRVALDELPGKGYLSARRLHCRALAICRYLSRKVYVKRSVHVMVPPQAISCRRISSSEKGSFWGEKEADAKGPIRSLPLGQIKHQDR